MLGTAGDVAHEALFMSVELLQFAPVPGLSSAALTLLNIWDALQLVDVRPTLLTLENAMIDLI